MGRHKPTLAELLRDPRFTRFYRAYLADPPDPSLLAPGHAALPVEVRARRYALFMRDLPEFVVE